MDYLLLHIINYSIYFPYNKNILTIIIQAYKITKNIILFYISYVVRINSEIPTIQINCDLSQV